MEAEKKFIEEAINKYQISKFLEKELDKAGFSRLEIRRTPLVTRIAVEVTNPGRVIGRKGKTIKDLTDTLTRDFKLENPQISVVEVKNPSLEPRIIAKKACRYIEMGKKVRAILHSLLREIMNAGALGAEIVASGKIAAKGARAKSLRVAAGYIPKAGEPVKRVDWAHVTAYPKSGAIGVLVRIVQPGTEFPDKKADSKIELPKVISAAEDVEASGSEEESDAERIIRLKREAAKEQAKLSKKEEKHIIDEDKKTKE
ncbi:MAG: 30S ribosomal protein S3 [Candidatus Anstonellales archaeon]